jgi:hypothetical protein
MHNDNEIRVRLVIRERSPLDAPQRRERYGGSSGLVRRLLVESAALVEAERRALHARGGAP